MTETMTAVETPATEPKAAKPKKAKAPAKKPAKPANPSTNGEAQYGVERSHDLPWNAKKVAVFKALKALKAVGQANAVSATDVAAKAGLSNRDVRHYVYHAKAAGLTGVADLPDVVGHAYYLTTKGANVDPAKAFKDQEAAKASK